MWQYYFFREFYYVKDFAEDDADTYAARNGQKVERKLMELKKLRLGYKRKEWTTFKMRRD